jgi:hypothetical protein
MALVQAKAPGSVEGDGAGWCITIHAIDDLFELLWIMRATNDAVPFPLFPTMEPYKEPAFSCSLAPPSDFSCWAKAL